MFIELRRSFTAEQWKEFIYQEYKYMQIWCVIKMISLRFKEEPRDKLRIRFLSHLCDDVTCESK